MGLLGPTPLADKIRAVTRALADVRAKSAIAAMAGVRGGTDLRREALLSAELQGAVHTLEAVAQELRVYG